MKVYKRNFLSLIWSLILALVALLFINFIVYWFVTEKAPDYTWVFYIVLVLSSVYLLYSSIFKENIKIELENKNFKYYENNKLKEDIDLSKVFYGYKIVDNSIVDLYLYEDDQQTKKILDCSPLGVSKFYELIEDIEKVTKNKGYIPEAKIIKKEGDK
jgi:hypothetical protein